MVVVDSGGPFNQADFDDRGVGFFGTEFVDGLLILQSRRKIQCSESYVRQAAS